MKVNDWKKYMDENPHFSYDPFTYQNFLIRRKKIPLTFVMTYQTYPFRRKDKQANKFKANLHNRHAE